MAGNENGKRSSRVNSTNLLSSDAQEAFSGNAEIQESVALNDNFKTDNIVWKQMGTAKGAGKLHMGGKWLNNIEVKCSKGLKLLGIIIFY